MAEPKPFELVARHVAAFNHGVATGDWSAFVDGFAADGEVVFVGAPVGPFAGRDAIRAAYEEQPPDDELRVLDRAVVGGKVVAAYGWARDGGAKAGLMVLTPAGDRLRRLVVTFDQR